MISPFTSLISGTPRKELPSSVRASTALSPGACAGLEPVVFAHGFGVPWSAYEAFIPLKRLFRRMGYELRVARTPLGGTIATRARVLRDEIKRLVPEGSYHLVGHSMGGLDSRLAIHRYGLGDRALSLTTLATPHRGSSIADHLVRLLGLRREERGKLGDRLLGALGDSAESLRELTRAHQCEVFNPAVPDDPRVRYFSMGFFIPEPTVFHSKVPWLWFTHELMKRSGEPRNDAMVGVDSSKWGEFLGAFPGDHYSETGPIPFSGPSYKDIFATVLTNLKALDSTLRNSKASSRSPRLLWNS